jgi:DNA-binding transcriptional regulator YbjK
MSNTDFNSLYTRVQYENSSYSRSSLISDAFNNNANYFTTAQVSRLLSLISDERTRLDLAKNSYSRVTDPMNFNQLYDLLNSSASRNELADYVRSNAQRSPAMNTTTFNALYRNMQGMYSSARVSSLSGLFNDPANYFTSLQVRQLLSLINSESERFDLAKAGYSRVVDPNGYAQVVDIFSSTTYRNQLNAYIGNYYGGGVNRTAMSSSDFSTIYRNVQMTFGFGAKYSSLTDIFKNNSYYFTTDQAEQLIRLVSDEDNRLALSKLAYSHLTDPENVSALYDMFQDQYKVTQLKDYIGTK